MARIAVEFVATGNMAPLQTQIKAVNTQLATMSAQLNAAGAAGVARLAAVRQSFLASAAASGAFTASTMKVATATATATTMLQKQEVTFRNRHTVLRNLNAMTQEQMRLQQASAVQWSRGMSQATGSLLVPNTAVKGLNEANTRASILNQTVSSIAANGIKAGKNMQWAGRQLTMGISLPIIALGVVSAKAAKEIDAEMTRLIKVYGDMAGTSEDELARVRQATMETAKEVAKQYGVMAKDTVAMGAELAAQGYQGDDLQEQIKETSRIMMLGEIDQATALKGTISIRQVYNKTAAETAETFNRLNAIENATTITTNELMMAIPKAAGATRQAGGSVEYLSAMLAAMRENGVSDISRAANSISSSMIAIAKPVPQTVRMFNAVGVSIEDMANKHKGDLKGLMEELAGLWTQMDATQRIQLFGQLFGKHRYKEMSELLSSISEQMQAGTTSVNSYGKSLEVIGASASTVRKVADTEIERMRKSASKQFDILRAQLNAAMADFGTPLMQVANFILKPIIAIFQAFNAMPSAIKQLGIFLLAMTALVGPVVMLIGLFRTLFFSIVQGVANLARITGKLQPVITAEQRLAQIIAGQTVPTIGDQIVQTDRLMGSIERLNTSLAEQIVLSQRAATAASTAATTGAAASQRWARESMAPVHAAQAASIAAANAATQGTGSRIVTVAGAPGSLTGTVPRGTRRQDIVDSRTARRLEESQVRRARQQAQASAAQANKLAVQQSGNTAPWLLGAPMPQPAAPHAPGGARVLDVDQARTEAYREDKDRARAEKNITKEKLAQNKAATAQKAALAAQGARFSQIAGTVSMISGMMTMIVGQGSQWANVMGMVLMTFSILVTTIPGIGTAIAGVFTTATAGVGMLSGAIAGIGAALRTMVAVAFGPAGAAILLLAGAFMFLRKSQDNFNKKNEDIANSSRDMAKTMGIEWNNTARKMGPAQKKLEDINAVVKDLQKNNKTALDAITGSADRAARRVIESGGTESEADMARDARIVDRVEQKGMEMVIHGADPKTIKRELDIIMRALGRPELAVQIDFEFENKGAIMKEFLNDVGKDLENVKNNNFDKPWWDFIPQAGPDKLRDAAKPMLKMQADLAAEMVAPFLDRTTGGNMQAQMNFSMYAAQYQKSWSNAFDGIEDKLTKKDWAAITSAGFAESAEGAAQYAQQLRGANQIAIGMSGTWDKAFEKTERLGKAEKVVTEQIIKRLSLDKEDFVTGTVLRGGKEYKVYSYNMTQAQKVINENFKTGTQAQDLYNQRVSALGENLSGRLTPAMRMQIASQIAANSGLDGLRAGSLVAGTAVADLTNQTKEAAEAALKAATDWGAMGEAFGQELRGTSSSALQDYFDKGIREFDRQTEVEEAGYDRRKRASDDRYDGEIEATKDAFRVREDALGDEERRARKTHEDSVKSAVDAVNKQIEAADKLDDKREKLFQAELKRMQRLGEAANRGIDFNIALDTGKLDEAARIMNAASVQDVQWSMEDAAELGGDAKAERRSAADRKITGIEARGAKESDRLETLYDEKKRILDAEKDGEVQRLEIAKQGARDRVDAQKKAYADARAAQKASMEEAARLEIESGAASLGQFTTRAGKIRGIFQQNQIDLKQSNTEWNKEMAGAFQKSINDARHSMATDAGWSQFGSHVANMMAEGATGMDWDEVMTYLATGKTPARAKTAPAGATGTGYTGNADRAWKGPTQHAGGMAGKSSGRAGRPMNAPLYKDEIPTVLQQGEYVIQRKAVKAIGKNNLDALNQGKGVESTFRHSGGYVSGFGASMAMTMAGRFGDAIRIAVQRKDDELMAAGATPDQTVLGGTAGFTNLTQALGLIRAGKYGDVTFTQEQTDNAAKILSVGRSMGGSDRDLVIGLMTAMQESSLRNLSGGDRDSVGLFQQRPSQGWGSVEQIMNPDYSSRKFFSELFKVRDRNMMEPTLAAQTVQRSAFPYAYAPWENEARALLAAASAASAEQQSSAVIPSTVKFVPGLQNLQSPDQDATWRRANGRNWLTGLAPGIARTVAGVLAGIPGGQQVTSALRTPSEQMQVNPNVPNSDHTRGKGIDIAASSIVNGGTAESQASGDLIAQTFRSLPAVKNVLWRTMQGGNHHNHVHVSFRHGGGEVGSTPNVAAFGGVGDPFRHKGGPVGHKHSGMGYDPTPRGVARGIKNDFTWLTPAGRAGSAGKVAGQAVGADRRIGQAKDRLLKGPGESDWDRKRRSDMRYKSYGWTKEEQDRPLYKSIFNAIRGKKLEKFSQPKQTFQFPGLSTGGVTLNDGYAKLHKSEAVLTAPLTRDLQEGIQNMDNSRSAVYNVNVTAGAGVDVKALAREVRGELEKFELRKGTNRRVG